MVLIPILSSPLFQKLKGLVRQKTTNSMPNPVAMGRAFLAKANNHIGNGSPATVSNSSSSSKTEATLAEVFGSKDAGLIPNKHRAFLMDTQVKYTVVSELRRGFVWG